jgi:predicted GNAT family N-acyltransferase
MNGIHYIELHARKSVVNFYIKLGYSMIVEEFIEVGIPHYKMFKKL